MAKRLWMVSRQKKAPGGISPTPQGLTKGEPWKNHNSKHEFITIPERCQIKSNPRDRQPEPKRASLAPARGLIGRKEGLNLLIRHCKDAVTVIH